MTCFNTCIVFFSVKVLEPSHKPSHRCSDISACKFVPVHTRCAMKCIVEVKVHALTLALRGGERSVSRFCHFIVLCISAGNHWTGSISGLDRDDKKILASLERQVFIL